MVSGASGNLCADAAVAAGIDIGAPAGAAVVAAQLLAFYREPLRHRPRLTHWREPFSGGLLVFRFEDFSDPYYAFRRGEEGARERFEEELGFLDALLQGMPWLSGRAFGLADVAFLPWVLRARDMLGIAVDRWPALADWLERSAERPSVAAELEVVARL